MKAIARLIYTNFTGTVLLRYITLAGLAAGIAGSALFPFLPPLLAGIRHGLLLQSVHARQPAHTGLVQFHGRAFGPGNLILLNRLRPYLFEASARDFKVHEVPTTKQQHRGFAGPDHVLSA